MKLLSSHRTDLPWHEPARQATCHANQEACHAMVA